MNVKQRYKLQLNFLVYKTIAHINHGTITKTGITCRKIHCYMRATQVAGGLLFQMLKCFEGILNIFEFSLVKEIVES